MYSLSLSSLMFTELTVNVISALLTKVVPISENILAQKGIMKGKNVKTFQIRGVLLRHI